MSDILFYLTPPLVGAFIGYLTNLIAIKMLFRPLKPWRFLGFRLPMTPGVIPSKRHELAENIGEMVGEHLLTGTDVSRALTEKGFQHELRGLIEEKMAATMRLDLGPIITVIPERFRSYFQASVKIVRWRTLKHLHNYIDSEDFAASLRPTISSHLTEFLAQNMDHFISRENRDHFFRFLESSISRFLAGPEVETWITAATSRKIKEIMTQGKSLHDLLPADIITFILARLEQEAPDLLKKIAAFMEQPEIQDKIADSIRDAVNHFIASLGPMASLVGNFIPPDAIGKKIREYLSANKEQISQWLLDENVQQKLAQVLRRKVEELLTTPLTVILKDIEPEKIKETSAWFSRQLLALLREPETAARISSLLRRGLETRTAGSLESLLAEMFGRDGLRQGKEWAAEEMIAIIRSTKVKRLLDQLLIELVENKIMAQPIGPLEALIPKAVRESLEEYILQQLQELLVREVPGLVDSLNIRSVVSRKVDSLDLLRLEQLLLSIMQEQFKYINIFGGLLGFVIGLLNLFVLLMR